MSIMGMREWFRKNRMVMIIVGALLLLGLLVSYGRFGSSSGATAADYEKAVESARAAYAEDSANLDNVQMLALTLAEYATFLNKNTDATQEEVNAVDQEALKYYDEYYGLLVLQGTTAYNEEPSYANAYMVASYVNQRSAIQANIDGMDGAALADETNKWMVIAMNHRIDEINAELAEKPNDYSLLSDLADATGAVAYYQHASNESFDLTPGYTAAINLLQQAIDNADADAKVETLSGFYQSMGSYAYNIDKKADAENYYKAALAIAPQDYNTVASVASFYLTESRYDESIGVLQTYMDSLPEDDENRESLETTINYIIGLRDAETGEITNAGDDADDTDAEAETDGEGEADETEN